MGYTHYWRQKRAFTPAEWANITAEAKRICAKAERGAYYTGKEDVVSATTVTHDQHGFRTGFNESYAWRTFPHPDKAIPMKDAPISLAGPSGEEHTRPEFDNEAIALNGKTPEDYESFVLERAPRMPDHYGADRREEAKKEGIFNFTKTEYRPYDAVVVSILYVAAKIAPDAITVSSDGGDEAIKMMF